MRESSGSGAGVSVIVKSAVAVMTELSELVKTAVMVVVPTLRPVASPDELTLAIVGMVELQLIFPNRVTSS